MKIHNHMTLPFRVRYEKDALRAEFISASLSRAVALRRARYDGNAIQPPVPDEDPARAPQTATTIAMSICSGIFNLGIGGGICIGGRAADSGRPALIGCMGAAIACGAALFCLLVRLPAVQRRP